MELSMNLMSSVTVAVLRFTGCTGPLGLALLQSLVSEPFQLVSQKLLTV